MVKEMCDGAERPTNQLTVQPVNQPTNFKRMVKSEDWVKIDGDDDNSQPINQPANQQYNKPASFVTPASNTQIRNENILMS